MPPQKAQSQLLKKFGDRARKAAEDHRHAEYKPPQEFGDLPSGISGIARLVMCRVQPIAQGKKDAGELIFMAQGIVLKPKLFTDTKGNEHNVAGLRTRVMEPMYDTPNRGSEKSRKTLEQHFEFVVQMLKGLGIDDPDKLTADQIENTMAALEQLKPTFRFSTRAGQFTELRQEGGKWYVFKDGKKDTTRSWTTETAAKTANPYAGKEPMVFHTWSGACEYSDEGSNREVVDETGEQHNEEQPGEPVDEVVTETPVEEQPAEESPDVTGGEEADWDALAEAATNDDEDAQNAIKAKGTEIGIEDEVVGAASWQDAVELIKNKLVEGEGSGEEPAAEEPQEFVPENGTVYGWQPIDPKTKKPAVNPKTKKPVYVQVEVTGVNSAKRTCVVKRADNKAVIKDVSWDKLEVL